MQWTSSFFEQKVPFEAPSHNWRTRCKKSFVNLTLRRSFAENIFESGFFLYYIINVDEPPSLKPQNMKEVSCWSFETHKERERRKSNWTTTFTYITFCFLFKHKNKLNITLNISILVIKIWWKFRCWLLYFFWRFWTISSVRPWEFMKQQKYRLFR